MNVLRRFALVVLAGLTIACSGEAPVENEQARKGGWQDEGPNLLSVLRGATIRDRSGEISLEYASVMAIDGHASSCWSTPPGNLEQWLIIELPVRSRIDALGLSIGTFAKGPTIVRQARFETSLDGVEWVPAATHEIAMEPGNQMQDISPLEARHIRVTTLTNNGDEVVTHVPTLLAYGEELDPWRRPSASGHWMLNEFPARLREDGSRVYGRIDMDPPMMIDGAWDGRVVRFAWARGRSYGVGLLAVRPDGEALNGFWWYENAVDPGIELGNPWFGTRLGAPDELEVATPAIAQIHVERDGRFPLFGIIFDEAGNFDAEASRAAVDFIRLALASFPQFRVRLEIGEYRSPDSKQNMALSQLEAASLRDGLVAMGLPADRLIVAANGSERVYPWVTSPLHWTMYSRVDFSFTESE